MCPLPPRGSMTLLPSPVNAASLNSATNQLIESDADAKGFQLGGGGGGRVNRAPQKWGGGREKGSIGRNINL